MIDWTKPVRGKKNHDARIVIEHSNDLHVFGYYNNSATVWDKRGFPVIGAFAITGEAFEDFALENIPQEPEREEGLWLVQDGGGYDIYGWDGDSWYCRGTSVEDPSIVFQRVYLSDEYRPADECPPPTTGVAFNVEGEEGRFAFCRSRKQFIQRFSNPDSINTTWYIFEVIRPGLKWKYV